MKESERTAFDASKSLTLNLVVAHLVPCNCTGMSRKLLAVSRNVDFIYQALNEQR
jgi:hypothetical protein